MRREKELEKVINHKNECDSKTLRGRVRNKSKMREKATLRDRDR